MKKILIITIMFLIFLKLPLSAQMSSTGNRMRQIRQFMQNKSSMKIKKKTGKKNKTKNKPAKYKIYKARIVLNNNKVLKGKVSLLLKRIIIRHYKNGILFKKVLLPVKIKSIEIVKYKSRLFRVRKKYNAYYFIPFKYKILYSDGNIYNYKKTINSLLKFKIINRMGQAILKTYFIDYWLKNKKKWYYSKSSSLNYPINNARGKTVLKIKFLK